MYLFYFFFIFQLRFYGSFEVPGTGGLPRSLTGICLVVNVNVC